MSGLQTNLHEEQEISQVYSQRKVFNDQELGMYTIHVMIPQLFIQLSIHLSKQRFESIPDSRVTAKYLVFSTYIQFRGELYFLFFILFFILKDI